MSCKLFVIGAVVLLACSWSLPAAAQTAAAARSEGTELNWRILPAAQPAGTAQQPRLAPPRGDAQPIRIAQLTRIAQPTGTVPSAELSLRPEALVPAGAASSPQPARDVKLNSQAPSLRVATAGPDTLIVGTPATYVITLANRGEIAARNVAVRIPLPSWLELQANRATAGSAERDSIAPGSPLAWNLEKLDSQSEETLSMTLVPKEGRGFDLVVDWSVAPSSATTPITVKEPKLALDVTGSEDLVFGGAAAWTMTLSNPGTGDVHAASLNLYSGAHELGSVQVGTIPAGGRRTVDAKIRPTETGTATVRAVAKAERGLEADASRTLRVRRADLQIQLEGSSFEFAGSEATYKVRVLNTGDADAEKVTVDLSLPQGVEYVSGVEAAQVSPSGVAWNIDGIKPGADSTFTIVCALRGAGDQQIGVKANTADQLVATDSVATRVQSAADLKLEVQDPKGPRAVDEDARYEIQVINRGTAAASQIRIVAICSPEVEAVDVTGNAAVESGQIFFRPIAELQPGEKIFHKVTVRAHKPGSHQFRVVVQCNDPDTRLGSDETTHFFVRPASGGGNGIVP